MTCKVIADKNKPIRILDCETNTVFSLENKEEALKFCDALNVTLDYVNELIDEKLELKKENEQLKSFKDTTFVLINEMIETANHYRTPIKSVRYGDDLGYWNGVYQKLKELRDILKGDDVE